MYSQTNSTEDLPYKEIPPAPKNYIAGNVIARMIDGLGYRYYWATEGLRSEDLAYRPTKEARSTDETIDHLYGLSLVIVNAPQGIANKRPLDVSGKSFSEKRKMTLENLYKARQLVLDKNMYRIEDYDIEFLRDDRTGSFPYWHMFNGPIADALYHVGQVVSFRRTSGNPMNGKVNVFMGKNNR